MSTCHFIVYIEYKPLTRISFQRDNPLEQYAQHFQDESDSNVVIDIIIMNIDRYLNFEDI